MAAQDDVDVSTVSEKVSIIFKMFDKDSNGKVSLTELKQVLQFIDPQTWTSQALDTLLQGSDTNGDGELQFTEFWSWVCGHGQQKREVSGQLLDKAVEEEKALRVIQKAKHDKWQARKSEKDRKAAEAKKKEEERAQGKRISRDQFVEDRVAIGLNKQVATKLYRTADEDRDGEVDWEELEWLAAGQAASVGQIKALFKEAAKPDADDEEQDPDMQQIIETFTCWDSDGNGTISAEDPIQPQQRYALKVVPCDHLDGEASARARNVALAEAELLRRLRHPHIVTCHEMRWDPVRSAVWLALDYMDGGDLNSSIEAQRRAGEAPPSAAFQRRVLAAVGSALRYIHALGVLHRDVKPCNVLLSQDLKDIKLADFGISKILEVTAHAHTVVGTPHYLSPEIVCGEPYGPASDAWALGVGLYELASLRRPFEASNQLALVRQIVEHRPPSLPAGVAPDIERAVFGLLEKDPEQRMGIADALAVSSAVKALAALPPPPLFPPPSAPCVTPRSGAQTSASTKEQLPELVAEEPELVRGTSDWSIITEVELGDGQPRQLPAEDVPFTPSPRRDCAFGLTPEEEIRAAEKKVGRGRSWFRFGLGLRSARARDESETVISAFSEEGDGSCATPQANASSKGSICLLSLPKGR